MSTALALNEAELAYLAGILDGEGHIGIERKGTRSFSVRVAVNTTSVELARWLKARTGFGGKLQTREKWAKDHHRQVCYEWRIFGGEAATVLRAVLPYLIVKRRQAEIAILYQQLPSDLKQCRGAELQDQLKQHNARRSWLRVMETRSGTDEQASPTASEVAVEPAPSSPCS